MNTLFYFMLLIMMVSLLPTYAAQKNTFLDWNAGCFDAEIKEQAEQKISSQFPTLLELAKEALVQQLQKRTAADIMLEHMSQKSLLQEILNFPEAVQQLFVKDYVLRSPMIMGFLMKCPLFSNGALPGENLHVACKERKPWDHITADSNLNEEILTCVSPNKKMCAKHLPNNPTFSLYNCANGEELCALETPFGGYPYEEGIELFLWSPDSKMLACCMREKSKRYGRIEIWDIAAQRKLQTIRTVYPEYVFFMHALQWSPDSTQLALYEITSEENSNTFHYRLKIFTAPFKQQPLEMSVKKKHRIFGFIMPSVSWSKDGKLFACNTCDEAMIFDGVTFKKLGNTGTLRHKEFFDAKDGKESDFFLRIKQSRYGGLDSICFKENPQRWTLNNISMPEAIFALSLEQVALIEKIIVFEGLSKRTQAEEELYKNLPELWRTWLEAEFNQSQISLLFKMIGRSLDRAIRGVA